MKTSLFGKYTDRLTSLNDQLCFFQFNRNELNKRLMDFGPEVGKLFTPDVFAQNSMAPRINVTIADLPSFQILNQTFTFGAYISTSYEVVSCYLKDSLSLLSIINSSTFRMGNDNQLEEKYQLTLASSSCTIVPIEITNTLKYIRLRRNHFTHLSETIDNQLSSLITTSGSSLNTFWSSSINHLNFTSLNVLTFEEGETIDILKILRILVKTLDTNLASNFSHDGIVSLLANREFAPKPQRINRDVIKERIRKIKTLSNFEFGITIADSIIEPIVQTIGAR